MSRGQNCWCSTSACILYTQISEHNIKVKGHRSVREPCQGVNFAHNVPVPQPCVKDIKLRGKTGRVPCQGVYQAPNMRVSHQCANGTKKSVKSVRVSCKGVCLQTIYGYEYHAKVYGDINV